VIESSVEEQIDRALKGRVEQRPFVDQLAAAWGEIYRGFTDLIAAADEVGRSRGSASSAENAARAAIAALLTGPNDAPAPVRRLTDRIKTVERLLDAVSARIGRDTVNIGVIGSTKVGKSTLLRTITGLPDTVIPTTQFNPTTASASRIYHTLNPPTAVLTLHTWESFRDTYLAPLHGAANLGPPPPRPADFRDYRYPAAGSAKAGAASADDFLRRLDAAQSSFGSYEQLLTGPRRTLEVGFEQLRPYVAYPDKHGSEPMDFRPYHAVQDVQIEQRFPDVAATKLGLIDLPGSGEAGLDIDTQFVQRVRNEIDFLLMVKRAGTKTATYLTEDSYALKLADSARGGAALEDFYAVVINRDEKHDPTGEYFANTLAEVRTVAQERRITVFDTDVYHRDDVATKLLRPVFDHLAATLARMDRANIELVLQEAGETAADVVRFADALAGQVGQQLNALPSQEYELHRLSRKLHQAVGKSLKALLTRYDALVQSGDADEPLTRGIVAAVQEATSWVDAGLGTGSTDAWFAHIEGPWVVGYREATQDEYYRAKTKITQCFANVDDSLEDSIHELWNQVADILRAHLTSHLVPVAPSGEETLKHLRDHTAGQKTRTLHVALDQLLKLKVEYGSIVLRVTRPIIRAIDPDPASARQSAQQEMRAAMVNAVVDGAAAAMGSPVPVAEVARKAYQWVTQPDGSRRRVPVAPAAPSASPPPVPSVPAPRRIDAPPSAPAGTPELYAELTTRIRDTIDQLQKKLVEEAHTMAGALAAATDAFFESMVRTNDVEWEYESLCGPHRREIWPAEFDEGIPRLTADVSALQEQARLLVAAATTLNEQRITLQRLP
jgi:hypothetical protein